MYEERCSGEGNRLRILVIAGVNFTTVWTGGAESSVAESQEYDPNECHTRMGQVGISSGQAIGIGDMEKWSSIEYDPQSTE